MVGKSVCYEQKRPFIRYPLHPRNIRKSDAHQKNDPFSNKKIKGIIQFFTKSQRS